MTNFKIASTLLLCASTIFAQDTAPKTLPELTEYARKNLSDFSITRCRDHYTIYNSYTIYRHIAHDLEALSLGDAKESNFDRERTKTTLRETRLRLMENRDALLQVQSAMQQEAAQHCSCKDISDIRKLYEQVIDATVREITKKLKLPVDSPVKDSISPNKKCADSLLKAMQATVDVATITHDLEVCDTIAGALEQIKL